MGTRRTSFSVTGSTNATVHSSVFQSTTAQPKRLKGVEVNVSAYNDNTVELWIDQDKYQDLYDSMIRSYDVIASYTTSSDNPIVYLEVEKDLEVGQQVTMASNSGGTQTSLLGCFVWVDLAEPS